MRRGPICGETRFCGPLCRAIIISVVEKLVKLLPTHLVVFKDQEDSCGEGTPQSFECAAFEL